MARQPIPYQDLMEALLATTPRATPDKVERLITELWQQALLLSELRPPLTTDNPARYVVQQLANVPAANEVLTHLESILDALALQTALGQCHHPSRGTKP